MRAPAPAHWCKSPTLSQTDLPRGKESGLRHVTRVLRDVPGIEFVFFTAEDVVRHPLVQKIVAAYEREESNNGKENG